MNLGHDINITTFYLNLQCTNTNAKYLKSPKTFAKDSFSKVNKDIDQFFLKSLNSSEVSIMYSNILHVWTKDEKRSKTFKKVINNNKIDNN